MEHATVRVEEDKMQTRRFKRYPKTTPLKRGMASPAATHPNVQTATVVLELSVYGLFVASLTMRGSLAFI